MTFKLFAMTRLKPKFCGLFASDQFFKMPSAVPFLNGVTVADVNVKCKSLIACDENTPVDKAYDLLNEQKIIAMPVYKPEGDKKSYTGILTVFGKLLVTY